jgi:hypothetical protein
MFYFEKSYFSHVSPIIGELLLNYLTPQIFQQLDITPLLC